jgi:hypothetical protein
MILIRSKALASQHLLGLLSSRVSNSSINEVLISGRFCDKNLSGSDATDKLTNLQHMSPFLNQKSAEHLAYALRCYQGEAAIQPDDCKTLSSSTLPYESNYNASCPFSAEICKSASGNLLIDTGPLSGYQHLGINKGPRLSIQHRQHCAPLKSTGFTRTYVDANRLNASYMAYDYGGRANRLTFEVPLNTSTTHRGLGGDYAVQ